MAIRDDVAQMVVDEIVEVSLHNGDPAGTGANEISGGGYTRLAPSFAAPSGGATNLSSPLEYDGPANQDVTHYGVHRAGGFWYARQIAGGPASFNSDGRLNLNSVPIALDYQS